MHTIVCIKSVLRSAPAGATGRTRENSELNLFDRPAIEAALRLRAAGGGTVTALTMAPPVGSLALAEARSMGVDRAVLISDPLLTGSDTFVTARVLATAISKLSPYHFIFFGMRTSDSDTGQVGPQTAAILDQPFFSGVKKIDPQEKGWQIHRVLDEWEETWHAQTPLVMTIHPRTYAPRHIGLGSIAQVYDQPSMETWGLSELGLSPDKVGLTGSPTRVAALQKIKHQRSCEMLEGDAAEQVNALVEKLIHMGELTS